MDADDRIRDLSGIVPDIKGDTLERLSKLQPREIDALPVVSGSPRIGACVGSVGKFICIGLNYADHAAEAGVPLPSEPIVFFKATSAITGPNDDVVLPKGSQKVDWEVELGLVIGRPVAYADEKQARAAIAGYCVINDLSERAWQIERAGQWVKGKSADGFGPIGPWLVTPDEVPDDSKLRLWLEVDGKRRQDSSTTQMIFKPAYLVSYLSQFMSLQAGDVIATGTPPGVGLGQKPPVYLREGQVIRLSVEGLGVQTQRVVAWGAGR
ncbi:MAG TPA: fumarylacetoacetate hydrolase family protein [Steroidobacteraceae bacterium]|jgi:2-keto-4-pentenoate hydratase/2-oxohepta-3-ene-1,7-dioic acid hydratase in catechol pathway